MHVDCIPCKHTHAKISETRRVYLSSKWLGCIILEHFSGLTHVFCRPPAGDKPPVAMYNPSGKPRYQHATPQACMQILLNSAMCTPHENFLSFNKQLQTSMCTRNVKLACTQTTNFSSHSATITVCIFDTLGGPGGKAPNAAPTAQPPQWGAPPPQAPGMLMQRG